MNITNKQKIVISSYFPELTGIIQSKQDNPAFEALIITLLNKIQQLKGDKGDKGDKPVKGKDYFTPKEIDEFARLILKEATPKKGVHYNDGKDYILTEKDKIEIAKKIDVPIVEKVLERVEIVKEVSKPVDISMIAGAVSKKELEEKHKKILDGMALVDGRIKLIDQRWRGGGQAKVYHDTTLSGDGTPSNPLSVIGGGGGVSVLTISGTVDDSNVTLTAVQEPSLLVINGSLYQKTGGSITWSYSSGTITLSSPVGTGGQIYGLVASSGGGGGGYTVEIPSGAIDDVNTTFTVTHTPVYIVIDGATYFEGAGYSRVGLTLTVDTPPALNRGFIRSFY